MKIALGLTLLLSFAAVACSDEAQSSTPASESALSGAPVASPQASLDLGIPPRHQWENGHGYCGETSVQSIGLHFGAWISQQIVRDAGGGEFLLAVNDAKALKALHFDFVSWDYKNQSTPQFDDFAVWTKSHLVQNHPVIVALYVTDGDNDPDYDHIVPAVGVDYSRLSSYDASDTLIFNDDFNDRIQRTFGNLVATRSSCAYDTLSGGCIPKKYDYGTAVSGITDKQKVSLPVAMAVDRSDEPNVSTGEAPAPIHATITVSGLTAGKKYALLRFDDTDDLPTTGSASDFLKSKYGIRVDFTAGGPNWTYADSFMSDGVAYYRAVPL